MEIFKMEVVLLVFEKEKEDGNKSVLFSEDKYYEVEVILR